MHFMALKKSRKRSGYLLKIKGLCIYSKVESDAKF